jgi:hypothetical protein
MAIKGKGRTRPKRVAKAPRREIVRVKPPFFLRRWVQACGAFVLGVLVSIFGIWLTNGLRESADRDAEAASQATARAAVQAWNDRLARDVAGVGVVSAGAPPVLLPEAASAIDDLVARKDVDEKILDDAHDAVRAALEAIQGFELTDTIRDQGLDVAETNYVLNSRDKVVEALSVYRQAIEVAAAASDASGGERVRLARIAADLRDRAVAQFADGFEDLSQAKASVGIVEQPTPPGLTGALGLP